MLMEQSRQFISDLQMAAKPRVYSYTRFSTPEQAKGDSYRRQGDAALRWAEKRGLELDDRLSIADEGVSAFRGTNAEIDKGLGKFLHACREGLIPDGSYLLVESLDRVSRMAPRRAQRLIDDIVDNGVTIVTLNDGQEYTAHRLDNDPTALLIALMVSWRAHEESKTKGRRVAEAWAEKRRKVAAGETVKLTALSPTWLEWRDEGWSIHPVHGETLRRVYRMTLEGIGEHKIAETLNREGVPPMGRGRRKGTMWHRSAVSKLLRNSAVIGTLTPGRIEYVGDKRVRVTDEPVPGVFPAVITEADWLAVRALKDGQTTAVKGRAAKAPMANVFSGLARCPDCGAAMTRVMKGRKKGGKPKLVCTRAKAGAEKHYVSVPVDQVHDAFFSSWQNLLADVPAGDIDRRLDREHEDVTGTIGVLEDQLSELLEAMDKQPSAKLAALIRELEQRLHGMRRLLHDVEERRCMADLGIVHSRLSHLEDAMGHGVDDPEPVSLERVNTALRVLFSGVTVNHRVGTLDFQWKQGGTTRIVYAWPE